MDTLLLPRRIGRWSYALRNAVVNLLGWPLALILAGDPTGEPVPTSIWFWILVTVIVAYWVAFVALPRCRDAGLPVWILFLLPVPIIDIGVFLILLGTGTRPEPFERTTPPPLPSYAPTP